MMRAKRWFISGVVQGVGFRYFAKDLAQSLGLTGWAKNLSDGRVEVFAVGTDALLSDFAAGLHKGPQTSQVRSVEEREAVPDSSAGFQVR